MQKAPTLKDTLLMCQKHCESKIEIYTRANVDTSIIEECKIHQENLQTLLNKIQK